MVKKINEGVKSSRLNSEIYSLKILNYKEKLDKVALIILTFGILKLRILKMKKICQERQV